MSYLITIRAAGAAPRTFHAAGDLTDIIANLPDDEPMGITAIVIN